MNLYFYIVPIAINLLCVLFGPDSGTWVLKFKGSISALDPSSFLLLI